jgi:hypothetical protein
MKRYFYLTGINIAICLIIISCNKVGAGPEQSLDTDDKSDNAAPVLTVTKPTANQVYASGDSIVVDGKAVDEKVMYKGKVQIKNDATGVVVAESPYETHFLNTLTFHVAYKAIVTAPTDFSAIIEFQDHGYNLVTSTIKVKVNP